MGKIILQNNTILQIIVGYKIMKLAEAVGKRTKELLFERKITQYRLVKITCLNEKTVSDIIKGKTNDIKFSTIYLIASAFNMSLQEFLDSPLFDMNNLVV